MDDVADACGTEAARVEGSNQPAYKRGTASRGWHDTDARRVQDCVIAARLGGGGDVTVAKDGTVTIAVKQSKDCVPPLVTVMQTMRAEGAEAARNRQSAWIAKSDARQHQPSRASGEELSKRARKRRVDKDKIAAERAELAGLRASALQKPPGDMQQPQQTGNDQDAGEGAQVSAMAPGVREGSYDPQHFPIAPDEQERAICHTLDLITRATKDRFVASALQTEEVKLPSGSMHTVTVNIERIEGHMGDPIEDTIADLQSRLPGINTATEYKHLLDAQIRRMHGE